MSRSPFWNQEAVMAAGLAFAGMAMLQSKLFTIVSKLNEPFLAKLAIWWPLLLIVGGLAVWFKKISERRSQRTSKSASAGGAK
jgi:hypothetical protein